MTGFNQIENTERAKQVLALVSRSGQFLPICLTFGPQNGPEDFAYVVDRVYAPGRHRKLRLMKQWLPYVDDLTVRTGRVLDGVIYRDSEMTARVREAVSTTTVQEQKIGEALEACGFRSKGLSTEQARVGAGQSAAPDPADQREKEAGSPSNLCKVKVGVVSVYSGSVGSSIPLEVGSNAPLGLDRVSPDASGEPTLSAAALMGCWEVVSGTAEDDGVACSRLKARARYVQCVDGRSGLRSPDGSSESETKGEAGSGRMSHQSKGSRGDRDDPVQLGKDLTLLLRHGKGVRDEELRPHMDDKGWLPIEKAAEWMGMKEVTDLYGVLSAAADHSKARIEVGKSISDPSQRFIRARHSWSVPWVTRGLDEADPTREPEVLYHGTLKKNWDSIWYRGLKSERELHGRRERLHVHLARQKGQVKEGSEIVIGIRTASVFLLAHRRQERVYANEKAVYVEFNLPVELFTEVVEVKTGRDYLAVAGAAEPKKHGPKETSDKEKAAGEPAASGAAASLAEPAATSAAPDDKTAAGGSAASCAAAEKEKETSKEGLQAPKTEKAEVARKSEFLPREAPGAPRPKGFATPEASWKRSEVQQKIAPKVEGLAAGSASAPQEPAAGSASAADKGGQDSKPEPEASRKRRDEKSTKNVARRKVTHGGQKEQSAEEALREKGAHWAKQREILSEEYSYEYETEESSETEEEKGRETSVDWGGSEPGHNRSRSPPNRAPAVVLKSQKSVEEERREAGSATLSAEASPARPTEPSGTPPGKGKGEKGSRSSTNDRRAAIAAEIEAHGSIQCPRCKHDNAVWRVRCYKCGLERADKEAVLAEHGDRRAVRARGKRGGGGKKKPAGWESSAGQEEPSSASAGHQSWSDASGWQDRDWGHHSWSSWDWSWGRSSSWKSGKYDDRERDRNHPFAHGILQAVDGRMVGVTALATLVWSGLNALLMVTEEAAKTAVVLVKVLEANAAEAIETTQVALSDVLRWTVFLGGAAVWIWAAVKLVEWFRSQQGVDERYYSPLPSPEKGKSKRRQLSPAERPSIAMLRAKALMGQRSQSVARTTSRGGARTSRSPLVSPKREKKKKSLNKAPRNEQGPRNDVLALEDVSRDPATVGLTSIRMFEDATSQQEAMIQALKRSRALEVICLSYAIDRAEIVGGLSAIAQCQKVPVRLVVDRAQTSRTQEQKRVLLEAVKQGLDVRLRSGAQLREHYVAAGRGPHNFLGIQHSKVLWIEHPGSTVTMFMGSANHTTAARGNWEICWELQIKKGGSLDGQIRAWIDLVVQGSIAMKAEATT